MENQGPLTSDRSDYACEPKPIGRGGFADVFKAVHKPTGQIVALKSLRSKFEQEHLDRMRREVDVMRQLAGHPNLMPVLGADPKHRWYVMPEATGSAITLRGSKMSDGELVKLVVDVGGALAAAHAENLVHRDVTPGNILQINDPEPRWVLADFGLVRRPPGETTALHTQAGEFGTYGFVAPELLRDAHCEATVKSDVYSLARVLTWAVTGVVPQPGDYEPPAGTFRRAVREATTKEPAGRSTLSEFVDKVVAAAQPMPQPQRDLEELAGLAGSGDLGAASELFNRALDRMDDSELFIDHVAEISGAAVQELARSRSADTRTIATRMVEHFNQGFGARPFDYFNVALRWLLHAVRGAEDAGDMGIFEDLAELYLTCCSSWDRWPHIEKTQSWLRQLKGPYAQAVARFLRDESVVATYHGHHEDMGRNGDPGLRQVLLDAKT